MNFQWKFYIFEDGHVLEQIKVLKDHTDVRVAKIIHSFLVKMRIAIIFNQNIALLKIINTGNNI